MREFKVSGRYARSLMDWAHSNNLVESVMADISVLKKTLQNSRDLELLLASPIINSGDKISVFSSIFKEKVQEGTFRFLILMLNKKREYLMGSMAESFIDLYYHLNGIEKVIITTSFPQSDTEKSKLVVMVESKMKKKAEAEFRINPEILGGIIIQYAGYLYDASVKHQLNKVKSELINKQNSNN